MSGGQLDTVLRHLRKLVGSPAAEDSDGRLLERFLARRDEAAFAALLARHGPMVWGVCRRLLPESHDAEDAFQATFLVLVRRARSLDRGGSLAGWLHAVAGRVALRARSGHARERPLTVEVPAMNATDPLAEAARQELRALIDEELRRLPEKYRGPVLMRDVQGRTHEEAARQLGYPPGSMSWRLARGRELLRERLTKRGVAPSVALAAVLLADEAVPAALVESTGRAALLTAAGTAGALPASVAALVDGAARALAAARLKLVAAIVALGLLMAGAGVVTHQALTAGRPAPAPPGEQAENDEPPPLPAPPPKDEGTKPEPPAPPPVEKPVPRVDRHGDPLPPGAVARLGTLRLRQSDGVSAFAFSPDGKLLATGGGDEDEWLHVWDVETGKLVRRLPESGVTLLAFSPDGKTLAVASGGEAKVSRRHRLWDLDTGKERLYVKKLNGSTSALAFAPDGKTLFACEEERVSTWDTTTGEPGETYVNDSGPIAAFALAPDGNSLAVIAEDAKKVIVVETTRVRRSEFRKNGFTFRSLAFSPDSTTLAAEVADGPILLLGAATGAGLAVAEIPRSQKILSVAFTPDGKELLAFNQLGELRAWDATTGKYLRSSPPGDTILSAALSSDGKLVAFTDRQDPGDQHALRLLDLTTGKDRLRLGGHESSVNSVAFSPDGKSLVSTGTDGLTVVWDLAAGRETWRVAPGDGTIGSSAFSPSGEVLAALGPSGRLELFDVATHKSLATFNADTTYCRSLAFSFDGKTLVFSAAGHSVWSSPVGSPHFPRPLNMGLNGVLKGHQVALDRSGRYGIATRGGVWLDDLSGKGNSHWLKIGKGSSPACVALAPDGATVAAGCWAEPLVYLFDAATGQEQRQVRHPDEQLRSVALSSGGRILATGGAKGSVYLFDTATGTELLRLTGHEGPVSALAFSADGSRLASAGGDTTVLVWDLARVWQNDFRPTGGAAPASLWNDLASPDTTFALWTTAVLAADPARTVAFFKERVKPVTPDHEERLRRAVTDLQGEDFKVREGAMEELRRIGPEAIPPLRELQRTATDPRLQARLRAFLTMAELDGVAPPPAFPRELRAVQVLEMIGTPEAREVLEELAKGAPSARLTEAAKAALGRWPR